MSNKGFSHIITVLLLAAFLLLLSGVYLSKKMEVPNFNLGLNEKQEPSVEIKKTPNYIEVPSERDSDTRVGESVYEGQRDDYGMSITSYTKTLSPGDKLELSWEFEERVTFFGPRVSFCIVAFDEKNKIIDTVDKDDNVCFYSYGGEHYGLELADSSFDAEKLSVDLPNNISSLFEKTPKFYIVKMLLLDQRPPEGLTEWAGTVGYAETGPIYAVEKLPTK